MGQQLVWTAGRQAALCAAGEGGVNIGVAVEALAGQGDKQLARRDGAAVGGDAGNGGGAVLQHRTAHGGAYLLNGTGNHGQIAPSARYGGPGGPRLMGASAHALTVFNSAINGTIIARRFRYDNRFSSEQTVNKKGRVRWTRPGRLLSQPVRLGPALYAGHKPHGDEQHQQR